MGLFPAFRGRWERSSCFWSMEQVCSETLGGVGVLVSCSGVHIQGNLFFLPSFHISLGRGSLRACPGDSKQWDEVVSGS